MSETSAAIIDKLLTLNQQLLDAIDGGDWKTYESLCDPSLTAYEPEAVGQLVQGMPFHRFYFEPEHRSTDGHSQSTICSPDVRLLGEVAVVCYVRLKQRTQPGGGFTTVANEETRIWQFQEGRWQHVHFHRSQSGSIQL